jgi:hypothetical protein
LKLAPLLAQYLYNNKRLDLPGIGTFLLDSSTIVEPENNKHSKPTNIDDIFFENDSTIKEAPDLIRFISEQTGKMKALAAADLDTHLEQAQQFLNIGKPFLFEGIGNLVKIRSGQFVFTSGQVIPEKMKEFSVREISSTSSTEESFNEYLSIKKKRKPIQPLVLLLLLFIGIGLAIWGGYTVYKRTTEKDDFPAVANENQDDKIIPVADSTLHLKKDSIPVAVQTISQGNYKFVVEVAGKERGLLRFRTFKSWGLNIKMETTDSTNFKLFFLLPASASDTARIIDSLRTLYTPSWGKAFVEN